MQYQKVKNKCLSNCFQLSSVTSAPILLPFLSVALHESDISNALLGAYPIKVCYRICTIIHIRIEIIHGSHTARVTQHSMASMNYFLNSTTILLCLHVLIAHHIFINFGYVDYFQ
jgi:hypothetical protein